jgi:hypothetical protein
MPLLVTIASFVIVAAAAVYVGVTVRRRLRAIEENTNLAWSGLRGEIERLYNETQRRLNTADRAAAAARDAQQRRGEEYAANLEAVTARLADVVTVTGFGERAASNGHRRHTFPGSLKVDGDERGTAIESFEAYVKTLNAALVFREDNAGPGRRQVTVAFGEGFDGLREKLGLDVEQAVEAPGPINGLLRIVGRQPASGLQIGPLVVVRADGEFHAALLLNEADMDDCHGRRLLDRPEVALAWLRRPASAYHFDLGPLLPRARPSWSPADGSGDDGAPVDVLPPLDDP